MFDEQFIQILACPRCKGPVAQVASGEAIICGPCQLSYPIRVSSGLPIPIMLEEEATSLADDAPKA